MRSETGQTKTWTNWIGNESCHPVEIAAPRSEDELCDVISRAAKSGRRVRVAGGGYSVSPIVATDGVLVQLDNLASDIHVEEARSTATLPAGMTLRAAHQALWERGFVMKTMGEIDTPQLGGAIGTGVHGAGVSLKSMSAYVRGARLVSSDGSTLDVDDRQPERLAAAQLSLGMLGVMTTITLEVEPAHGLHESLFFLSVEDALARWDELIESHHHYGFFYLPRADSYAAFGGDQIPPPPPGSEDICFGMARDLIDSAEIDMPVGPAERRGRSYAIITAEFEPNFREIELAVPLASGRDAFMDVRELMLHRYPDSQFPIDVRFVAGDDALLSPYAGGDKAVFSICAEPDSDYRTMLGDFEAALVAHGGAPHWGKLSTLDTDRLDGTFPGATRFRQIRQEMDPAGVFLNDHLASLFA
jgi:FAD/FMN-containing dehydrogenase